MERFKFHHPQLYGRILMVALITVLTSGLGSVLAFKDRSPSALVYPGMTPPGQTEAKAQPVNVPSGWHGVSRLPGRDGSGKPVSRPVAAATAIPLSGGNVLSLGRELNAVMFGDVHWPALQALWNRESGWNPNARNPYSGACGIPQALPCSKIPDMSPQGQIQWGLNYIKNRYGTPTNAWRFWQANNWY